MKMKVFYSCLLFFTCLLFSSDAFATHNRAGEITVEQIDNCSDYTVRATIITYTKASSTGADRDTLTICWGDGMQFCESVARANGGGNGEVLENDIKVNHYVAFHTYPGAGRYTISMTDPNRNAGIENVNAPNSDQVQFHIQTVHTLFDCQFGGINNSPILDYEPIDVGCIQQVFNHNPGAYDPDGDSLSYQLIQPFGDIEQPVPNYFFPNQINGVNNGDFFISSSTGLTTWNAPVKAGEYNFAFIIISWRGGVAIDTMVRDMQVTIFDCDENQPPSVETIDELCVIAGEFIEFRVTGDDPDDDQKIKLTARGGPFEVSPSPAQFDDSQFFEDPLVDRFFRWQTTCEHIAKDPYGVVFRVTDNYLDTTGLSTLKTVNIKVVGPSPKNLEAIPIPGEIELYWDNPYECEEAEDDYFYGFSVWRLENSNNFPIDDCEPGLEGQGYTKITPLTNATKDGRYYYKDSNVERGKTYCYRILAIFSRYTEAGNPFNTVESLPSEEVCVQLKQDVPLLTNIDIITTDENNGIIDIKWIPPRHADLDTIANPGPYKYQLLRSEGIGTNDFSPIDGAEWTVNTYTQLSQINSFTENDLDTKEKAHTYKLDFFIAGNDEPIKSGNSASSVFLNVDGADERLILSWDYNTPWVNDTFLIYKEIQPNNYQLLDTVTEPTFTEFGLVNGRTYCYYIESQGQYSVEGIPAPLINHSQINCGEPLDTVPPCPPILTVSNICDTQSNCTEAELNNTLVWNNPNFACEETDDVIIYNIYYTSNTNSPLDFIAEIDNQEDTIFQHMPLSGIAGCYAVTAVDSFFNESLFSNKVCVDNCPIYELPNTFTPNDDNQNDIFKPYPYCFIESIDINIFNRWGELIFQTTNPDILWDGTATNGKKAPSGTYYYTCQVFEQRVEGIVKSANLLNGYIELIAPDR